MKKTDYVVSLTAWNDCVKYRWSDKDLLILSIIYGSLGKAMGKFQARFALSYKATHSYHSAGEYAFASLSRDIQDALKELYSDGQLRIYPLD